jgi:protein-tyrosine phosphatase
MTQNSKLKTQNCIDYHCHLLPGLDDGAVDMAEAIAMARILAEAGFSEVCCTPHSIPGLYETSPDIVRETLYALRWALDQAGIHLTIIAGTEYYFDEFLMARLVDPLTIGAAKLVLIEAPSLANASFLAESAYQAVRMGLTPLIAHPERCSLFAEFEKPKVGRSNMMGSMFMNSKFKIQNSKFDGAGLLEWFKVQGSKLSRLTNLEHGTLNAPSNTLIEYLVGIGCLFQANIGSFSGAYGERVQKRAMRYLEEGLYDCLGSDAHCSRCLADRLDKGLREIERHAGTEGLRKLLKGMPGISESGKQVGTKGWGLAEIGNIFAG